MPRKPAFNEEYQRAAVQLPLDLAAEIAQRAATEGKSQSAVIVSMLRETQRSYPHEQISRWMDDELALLKAAPLALTVLNGKTNEERLKAATDLANAIINAALRRESQPLASEARGSYTVPAPPAKQNPTIDPERKRNPKTA